MTQHKEKGPLLAQADPLDNEMRTSKIVTNKNTATEKCWQVTRVASRYRIPPQIARLICNLQRYGGANG